MGIITRKLEGGMVWKLQRGKERIDGLEGQNEKLKRRAGHNAYPFTIIHTLVV